MPIKPKKVVVSKKETTTKKPRKAPVKKVVKKVGRPNVIDDVVVSKLEEGFLYGLTDEQACLYAGISKATLHRYIDEHPEFWDRKEILKNQPKIDAKITLAKSLKPHDDPRLALEVLKNTMRDEYNTRQELTGKDGNELQIPEIKIKIIE